MNNVSAFGIALTLCAVSINVAAQTDFKEPLSALSPKQSGLTEPKTVRSAAVVSAFKRHNPCPATGQRRGACPGYIIDHIEPLCAGGPDTVANMQWQTREVSLAKDVEERRLCRSIRQGAPL